MKTTFCSIISRGVARNASTAALTIILAMSATTLRAQVHVGDLASPKATLEVTGKATDTTAPGVICPRLTLTQLNSPAVKSLYGADQKGALVYITSVSGSTVAGYSDQVTCVGYIWWDGVKWISLCAATEYYIEAKTQPKAFTFYEKGTETVDNLTFTAITNGAAPTYQWYKITGSNVHVRIAEKCTATDGSGYNTNSFKPTSVIKGTTIDAANTGFYKYFCVAKTADLSGDSAVSNIAEVAVGCGAKTVSGEWTSFLCFNLGARKLWIDDQKNYSLSPTSHTNGIHIYVDNEEYLYGDLYQWGRIGDGHQFRVGTNGTPNALSNQAAYGTLSTAAFESGNVISAYPYTGSPYNQIKRDSTKWYGMFILNGPDLNWAYSLSAGVKDGLWPGIPNDPCTKIKLTYTGTAPFNATTVKTIDATTADWFSWYPSTDNNNSAGAGTNKTGWRLPTMNDWVNLYRGTTSDGAQEMAFANTWVWYNSNGRGFEVRPDGNTTTLFLPANGYRDKATGMLVSQGASGTYWSSSYINVNAYYLSFHSDRLHPANSNPRGYGFGIRCTKSL
jgi:uncharacterized protein (TIGR02145 family)